MRSATPDDFRSSMNEKCNDKTVGDAFMRPATPGSYHGLLNGNFLKRIPCGFTIQPTDTNS